MSHWSEEMTTSKWPRERSDRLGKGRSASHSDNADRIPSSGSAQLKATWKNDLNT